MRQKSRTRLLLLILIAQGAIAWIVLGPPRALPTSPPKSGGVRVADQPAHAVGGVRPSARPAPRLEAVKPAELRTPDRKPSEYNVLKKIGFDSPTLNDWEEKIFKGRTAYTLTQDERTGQRLLRASSSAASSGLYNKFEYDVVPGLKLSWQWRVRSFPKKPHPDKLADRSQDDFAARVYAIFPGSSFFKTDVIEYIWDEHLPVGTVQSSPFSSRLKLYVIRSGPPGVDDGTAPGLLQEERDVYEDYFRLFGQAPKKKFGAIALMSDSDNTGTTASADFAEIILKQSLGQPRLVPAPRSSAAMNNFSTDIDNEEGT